MLLALDFFREPLLVQEWSARATALPAGIGELIRLAGARDSELEAVAADYQADARELGESARFFLQQVLLAPGADHYRVLGVERDADDSVIRSQHRLLMRLLHPDRHVGQAECWTDVYATRVNQAYNVLRHAQSRANYDRNQPEPVVVSAATVSASASDEESALMRQAMAKEAGRWSAREAMPGGLSTGPGGGQNRTMLFAGLALLLLAFALGWAIRGDQPMVVKSGAASPGKGNEHSSTVTASDNLSMPRRENGISIPRLASLALAESDGAAGVETLPNGAEVSRPLQTEVVDEVGAVVQPEASEQAIPRSRRAGESGAGRHRAALVIPPARIVDVPEPKSVTLPEAARVGESAREDAAQPPVPSRSGPAQQAAASARADGSGKQQAAHQPEERQKEEALAQRGGVSQDAAEVGEQERQASHSLAEAYPTPPGELLPVVAAQQSEPSIQASINEAALMALLGHLVSSYQRGDLVAFVGLFADIASTSDEANRAEIEQEYRQLFSTSRARSLQVSDLSWRLYDSGAQGSGYMVIQIRRKGRAAERYQGRFIVHVTRERQQLRISALYYDLERA